VQEPDPRLIRAAADGDLDAFEAIVRAYQAHIWRFLRHLLTDAALAEDITQETFIRVHRRLGSFRFQSKFSTWLFSIARNAGIDALRSRDRRRGLLAAVPERPPQPDPGGQVELKEAVASLPDRLREAFTLIEVFGLTYREAGEAIGVPEGTVKSRVFHARRQLVAWLQAADGGEADAL
jgi:RNA polymerase sigma-70 factor, ECF subfamily